MSISTCLSPTRRSWFISYSFCCKLFCSLRNSVYLIMENPFHPNCQSGLFRNGSGQSQRQPRAPAEKGKWGTELSTSCLCWTETKSWRDWFQGASHTDTFVNDDSLTFLTPHSLRVCAPISLIKPSWLIITCTTFQKTPNCTFRIANTFLGVHSIIPDRRAVASSCSPLETVNFFYKSFALLSDL